jgi:hypothetical protein
MGQRLTKLPNHAAESEPLAEESCVRLNLEDSGLRAARSSGIELPNQAYFNSAMMIVGFAR